MFRSLALLMTLLPAIALALPAEDHWSPDPDTPFAKSFVEAEELIETESYGAALPILQDLAEEAPCNADVFNMLGYAYRKTGDLENSGPAYERALFLDPDHLGALEYQGELFLMLGDPAAAETNLERLTELCPTPCEETDELAAEIETWRAANSGTQ